MSFPLQTHQYVKAGTLATCDDCGVTQPAAKLVRMLRHGVVAHRCRDEKFCRTAQREGPVNLRPGEKWR